MCLTTYLHLSSYSKHSTLPARVQSHMAHRFRNPCQAERQADRHANSNIAL